jgi:hypothetical protein
MATHRNPSIAQDCLRIFNFKQGDTIGSDVGEIIVPVVEINPCVDIVRENSSASTGSITLYTTPADKDFYLTYASLDFQADATADNTSCYIQITQKGVARRILSIRKLSLTATSKSIYLNFNPPIKCDKNTGIIIGNSFSVGASTYDGAIGGYLREVVTTTN